MGESVTGPEGEGWGSVSRVLRGGWGEGVTGPEGEGWGSVSRVLRGRVGGVCHRS